MTIKLSDAVYKINNEIISTKTLSKEALEKKDVLLKEYKEQYDKLLSSYHISTRTPVKYMFDMIYDGVLYDGIISDGTFGNLETLETLKAFNSNDYENFIITHSQLLQYITNLLDEKDRIEKERIDTLKKLSVASGYDNFLININTINNEQRLEFLDNNIIEIGRAHV